MITKEELIAEIEKVPDEHLEELYKIIKDFEPSNRGESGQSLMSRLRQVKISASPDFSTKADLCDAEAHNAR